MKLNFRLAFITVLIILIFGCATKKTVDYNTVMETTGVVELDADFNGATDVSKGGTNVQSYSALKTVLDLDDVDNTSDADKPVSDLTQTALDLKADQTGLDTTNTAVGLNTDKITEQDTGTNTGNQVGDGVTITGTGTILDPFVGISGISDFLEAKIPGKQTHLVAGVLRYYTTLTAGGSGWGLIDVEEGGHPSVNIASVTNSTSTITINFDTTDWGSNPAPACFIATPDETLLSEGVASGASVGTTFANLQLSKPGTGARVYWGGSQFSWSNKGIAMDPRDFTISDELEMSIENTTSFLQYITESIPPALTPIAGKYTPKLSSWNSQTGAFKVKLYDDSNTLITAGDADCEFYVSHPGPIILRVDGSNWPDKYGNIWFMGVFSSDEET